MITAGPGPQPMTLPFACLAAAAALVCLPGSIARARIRGLWPPPPAGRYWRPRAAGPVLLSAFTGFLAAGPGGAIAAALLAATARSRHRARRSARTAGAVAEELADAVQRMAEELRSGSHPTAALTGATADGPLARGVLGPAAAAARLGDDVPAALRRTGAERPELARDVERIAAAWTLAERHGIPLAALLGAAQHDIRWRVRFSRTVAAQLAGPRATATVLTTLPALGLGLGQLMGADPVGVLRGGMLGQVLIVVGVGLAAAGSAWTEQILRTAVPR